MASRLMGGGGRSAEFDKIGDGVRGFLIEEPSEAQQTEYQDKTKLKFYRNGQPAMMSVLRLQTQDRVDDEDDGIRILCVADLSNRQQAIAQAVRGAGCGDVEVGGWLEVVYYADGEPREKGNRPPKLYTARWVPPQPKQSGIMAGGPPQQAVQQAPTYQQQQPPQQYAQQQPPVYQQPQQQFPNPQQGPPPQFAPNPAQNQAPPQQQGFQIPEGMDMAAVQAALANLNMPTQQ